MGFVNPMPLSLLEQSMLKTIAYFDTLRYPITSFEWWQYLFGPLSYTVSEIDVIEAWEHSQVLQQRISFIDGLYVLRGHEEFIALRQKRYILAHKKFAIARKMIGLLSHMPFVRMICVCNDLAFSHAPEDSDIDLFIVGRVGHLWLVRFMCAFLMHALGVRPTKKNRTNKICLSFYVSDSHLNLSPLALPRLDTTDDVHFTVWVSQFVPVYDEGRVYEQFFKENAWVSQLLPNRIQYIPHRDRMVIHGAVGSFLKKSMEWFFSRIGSPLEQWTKQYQFKILPPYLREQLNKDSCVVFNDQVMKFHPNDRRGVRREQFIHQYESLIPVESSEPVTI